MQAEDAFSSLSIIKLGESLNAIPTDEVTRDATRMSDASSNAPHSDVPTPASLEADLTHYKELFTKLRFSYVEQVTKEKFLRAVVGDPPLYISASENAALESRLLSTKATLKAQKIEVAELVAELESRGRELSRRYQQIQLQTAQLDSLPEQIDGLKSTIARLQAAQEPKTDNPLLAMPLTKTLEVLAEKDAESAKLDREIEELRAASERRARELDRMQTELEPLRAQKIRAVNDAQDAQTRKAQGISGLGDDLEQRGRWLRGVETTMRSILEAGA